MDSLDRDVGVVGIGVSPAIVGVQRSYEIEALSAEALIGRAVTFVLRPELRGQITGVHVFRAGRTISVAYFEGDVATALDCDGFQLELCED